MDDVFNETIFAGDQREIILQAIKRCHPDYFPTIRKPDTSYSCRLLKNLNRTTSSDVSCNLKRAINSICVLYK